MKHVKLYENFRSEIPSITTGAIQSMNDDDFVEYLESLLSAGRYEEIMSAVQIKGKSSPEFFKYSPRAYEILDIMHEVAEASKKGMIDPYLVAGFQKEKEWEELQKAAEEAQKRLDNPQKNLSKIAELEREIKRLKGLL